MDLDGLEGLENLDTDQLKNGGPQVIKGQKDTSFVNSFLRLLDNGETEEVTITIEARIGGVEKIEGDNISYGNPIEINLDNIHDLGLDNDIVTYRMDENGNFHTETEDGWDTDFEERSPEEFLFDMSKDGDGRMSSHTDASGTTYSGLEDESFMLQRVELDGVTHGYFISGKEGNYGFYIGPDEIDYAGLPQEMREQLALPEPQAAPAPQAPTPQPNLDQYNRPTIPGMQI